MFNKPYEERLALWREFRQELETCNDPFQRVVDYYQNAPFVTIQTDPYDRNAWPDPWELIEENQYCEFCKRLGYCYALQLTTRFSQSQFEIHIKYSQRESALYYLLIVDDVVLGFDEDRPVSLKDLPEDLVSQQRYVMPKLR